MLHCRLEASPTNISLGWKGLPSTNTQDYCENPEIKAVKSFIRLAPQEGVVKLADFGFARSFGKLSRLEKRPVLLTCYERE